MATFTARTNCRIKTLHDKRRLNAPCVTTFVHYSYIAISVMLRKDSRAVPFIDINFAYATQPFHTSPTTHATFTHSYKLQFSRTIRRARGNNMCQRISPKVLLCVAHGAWTQVFRFNMNTRIKNYLKT